MAAGLLDDGVTLHARGRRAAGRTATVLSDGSLDVDGVRYSIPVRRRSRRVWDERERLVVLAARA